MQRSGKIATAVALVVALSAGSWFVYDVLLTRPRIVRVDAARRFGVERANVPAPPFELAAPDGSRLSLAALRGQVVFVNFWATWCPPCRDEMPSMVRLGQELARRHPGKFKMVAVSVDDSWQQVNEYFAAPPFAGMPGDLAVVLDPSQASARAYYCSARGFCPDIKFPETYIVDQGGRLVGYIVGPRDWDQPAAREYLDQLLGS